MKLHKRIKATLLAARIEYHWWFILRGRKKGERWISCGEAMNSKRLLRLNRQMNFHDLRVKKLEKCYKAICGFQR